jgi:hypothetical protein
MSPKKMTRIGLIGVVVSIVGALVMFVLGPEWGVWNWWPAMGLGLSLLLFVVSFLWGAYLAAQKRAEMVDLLNDCYTGVKERAR